MGFWFAVSLKQWVTLVTTLLIIYFGLSLLWVIGVLGVVLGMLRDQLSVARARDGASIALGEPTTPPSPPDPPDLLEMALLDAVSDGDIAAIDEAIENGLGLNTAYSTDDFCGCITRETPLIRAVERGRHDMVNLLVERGARLDVKGSACNNVLYHAIVLTVDFTPLDIAVVTGQMDTVCLLLELGAARGLSLESLDSMRSTARVLRRDVAPEVEACISVVAEAIGAA